MQSKKLMDSRLVCHTRLETKRYNDKRKSNQPMSVRSQKCS